MFDIISDIFFWNDKRLTLILKVLGVSFFVEFNFTLSFYIHITGSSAYNKITFKLNGITVQTDNGGNTNLVSFYLPDKDFLNGAVAMSFEWECIDPLMDTYNLSDNYQDKEKEHLALMLYEVFLGKSTWF